MPRKRNNRRSRRNTNGSSSSGRMTNLAGNSVRGSRDQTIERGSGLITFVNTSPDTGGAVGLNLSVLSTNIPRFAELMESYQLFRFRRIQIKVLPQDFNTITGTPNPVGTFALAYSPGDPTGATTQTTASTLSYPNSIFMNGFGTIPQILSLGPNILLRDSQSKWYRTQPSAAVETWEENQGELLWNLSIAPTAGSPVTTLAHMFYELELAGQVAPSNIPAEPPLTNHFLEFIASKLSDRFKEMGFIRIDTYGSNIKTSSKLKELEANTEV